MTSSCRSSSLLRCSWPFSYFENQTLVRRPDCTRYIRVPRPAGSLKAAHIGCPADVSNRHRLRDQLLGLACLPVPPRRQTLKRWCPLSESNRRPAAYKAAALPAELNGRRKMAGPAETRTHIHLLAKQRLCQLERQAREIMVGSQGVEPRVSRRTAGLRPVAVASAARCPSNWCGRWDSNPWPRRWRRRVLPD
jgi:hypothetical protein